MSDLLTAAKEMLAEIIAERECFHEGICIPGTDTITDLEDAESLAEIDAKINGWQSIIRDHEASNQLENV